MSIDNFLKFMNELMIEVALEDGYNVKIFGEVKEIEFL